METRHEFNLSFLTDRNSIVSFNIPRALSTASAAQISDAMTAMIDSEAMVFSEGEPLFRQSARLVTTERREIDVWS